MTVPSIKLNSGHDMPQVGFGLWKVDNATCADTVYNAIKVGYRLFDGACGMSFPPQTSHYSHIPRESSLNQLGMDSQFILPAWPSQLTNFN